MEIATFTSFDRSELFYRKWNFNSSQKTIIVLHRGHEHSGRLKEFAADKHFSEYNIFAYDQRGLGHTKQEVSPVFMDYVRDLDSFVVYLNKQYGICEKDIFIVANSIAGVILSAWVHDFAPKICGMALLAPAFQIKLYMPFAKEMVALGTKLNKNFTVPSYVKSKVLTHDPKQQQAYDSDPLITKSINGRMLVDMLDAGERIIDDAAAINTPTLVLSAEKDYVVQNSGQKKFFVRIESQCKKLIGLKGFYHGILFEQEKEIVYNHVFNFMEKCYKLSTPEPGLEPDKFSRDEYDILSLKLIPLAERMNFAFQKWSLSKIGSLSKGMDIGLKYGFDSGISLDYVYRNKPQGQLGIGKMMDYFYLNAIGWRGIRTRKKNLIQTIENKITELQKQNKPIRILDIAGGTGNYLFDIKNKYPDVEIVVNDFISSNTEAGQKIINETGVKNMRFTNYDCFDNATYKKLDFTPNIVIISGIFELFDDNEQISNAIVGAVSISEPNGTVIYTGQPWHPQLKMIAYVLKSHQDKDWVMRRRSQKELDRIFALNNVSKESMLIDDYGIFTVSCGKVNTTSR